MKSMQQIICMGFMLIVGRQLGFAQALPDVVPGGGILKFEAVAHDFGDMALGADGLSRFTFINVGTESLRIQDVQCSDQQAIEWPQAPIAPGIERDISFGIPTDQLGFVYRQCTLSTDGTPSTQVLTIRGNVLPNVLPKVGPPIRYFQFLVYEDVPYGGVMTFEEETHDFGEVEQGGDVYYSFKFINTGTTWLRIDKVGCSGSMSPRFSGEQVAPGEAAEIGIKYDSNIIGEFNKSFSVRSNAVEPGKVLWIKGNVLRKEPDPAYVAPMEGVPVNGR